MGFISGIVVGLIVAWFFVPKPAWVSVLVNKVVSKLYSSK